MNTVNLNAWRRMPNDALIPTAVAIPDRRGRRERFQGGSGLLQAVWWCYVHKPARQRLLSIRNYGGTLGGIISGRKLYHQPSQYPQQGRYWMLVVLILSRNAHTPHRRVGNGSHMLTRHRTWPVGHWPAYAWPKSMAEPPPPPPHPPLVVI